MPKKKAEGTHPLNKLLRRSLLQKSRRCYSSSSSSSFSSSSSPETSSRLSSSSSGCYSHRRKHKRRHHRSRRYSLGNYYPGSITCAPPLPRSLQECIRRATVTLTPILDGRQAACSGEVVTYTCTVTQAVTLDWTAETFIMDSNRLQFTSTTPAGNRALACSDSTSTVQCADFDYQAILTSVGPVQNGFADMTSTFRLTASARVNGTVVQCRGSTATGIEVASSNLIVTAIPSPPQTPSSTVQQYGRDSVTLTVQWQPPQYDGGAPVNYTITVSPGLSPVTTVSPSTLLALPYNVMHTVRIVATNCNGSSSAAMETIRIANCSDPTAPGNGSFEAHQCTTEIFLRCNPGFAPAGVMRAVCENGRWNPDPATLVCSFDCGRPVAPRNGYLESYSDTTEGSEVFYRCDPGLVPEGRMRAVCTRNGWSPNPAYLSCAATCSDPTAPRNGVIETYQTTLEGAEIFFRCNTGYVPTGRTRAVCGINGRWNPDPADHRCTVSTVVCRAPTVASGVIVLEPHSTTVSSVIVYQCQKLGFTPSAPSSVCEEDGRWSPDPSQVTCMVTSVVTTMPTDGVGSLNTGATVGIAVASTAVVTFIAGVLAGVLLYHCISKHRCQSSKPESSSHEQQREVFSHQQPQSVSSSNPLPQTGPEYEEVVKLRKNASYELTKTGLEMNINEAYQSTQQ